MLCCVCVSGDAFKAGLKTYSLYVPNLQPNRSYFIVPSTSAPGLEGTFSIKVFGNTLDNLLHMEACALNQQVDPLDHKADGGLASFRAAPAAGAGARGAAAGRHAKHDSAALNSVKARASVKDSDSGATHRKGLSSAAMDGTDSLLASSRNKLNKRMSVMATVEHAKHLHR